MLRNKGFTPVQSEGSLFFTTILWSGFLVGWLDILAAFINTYLAAHIGPVFVLRFIAAGLFGREAFNGGKEMAAYGMLIHFFIAYAFTILLYALYGKFKILGKYWIVTGIVYGILIWLIMNLIVVPMTLLPKGHFQPQQVAIGMAILIAVIGLPLSYFARGYYRNKI